MTTLLNMQDAPIPAAKNSSSDGSHWYVYEANQWSPLYTPEKNYTLRQARVDKEAGRIVVPSVTTIFGVLAKPQLEKWKMERVAEACWEQRGGQWDRDAYIEQAVETARNSSRGAMDLGQRIHQAIEDCIAGRDYAADLQIYVCPVMAKRAEMGIRWSLTEQCVGSTKYGYAGRCDDHTQETITVRDFKSRKSKGKKVPVYETDFLQLAAYAFAIFGPDFFKKGTAEIWGISTSEPGLLTVHTKTGPEMIEDFQCFLALQQVWQAINKFQARITT